ncbi:MAG TPA: class I SAM-dependent methyltransferase [Chitinophaga sp.]|uniref:class I SAM-dependent methyltransferase n=1 Tax=Chitinophaga sp. TaxID=1869181 RepID=UPI002C964F40|nr:class I SAM-dependent methyltransferase [Chitinophaga sp.]HVI43694.1 class I SAM-dependent methyltransferase [Chitinophaga sp.]
MIAFFKTAERTHNSSSVNNYVFQRHVFAYKAVPMWHLENKKVLELGCGNGYGIKLLAPYTRQYIAVDKTLPAGEHLSIPPNALYKQCQLPALPFIREHSFDTVICFQVIEHIKDDHALLKEIKRVLKPGGTLFMTTPNRRSSLTRNPFHVREYLPQEITALMALHFEQYDVEGVYGNETVMSYYEENKKSVTVITRFDIFNLQYKLPACLLRIPYTLMNNLNRVIIHRSITDISGNIADDDFFIQTLNENCLDYFVTAVNSRY